VSPPVKLGGSQVRPKVDFVLYESTSAKLVGESGVVVILAPLPANEATESPYKLRAITLAKTWVPHSNL